MQPSAGRNERASTGEKAGIQLAARGYQLNVTLDKELMSANGSNPRLDRIEKLIEQSERANKEAHARHVREMAEIRAEGRKAREDMREDVRRTREDVQRTRDDLRRWAALGVKEARNQRKRHQEIDLYITRLAAAQLVTEEKLANFIASLAGGRNGGGRKAL